MNSLFYLTGSPGAFLNQDIGLVGVIAILVAYGFFALTIAMNYTGEYR